MAESSNANFNLNELYCPMLFYDTCDNLKLCPYKHVNCNCNLAHIDVRNIVCKYNLNQNCRFGDKCDLFHYNTSNGQQYDRNSRESISERSNETLEIVSGINEASNIDKNTTRSSDSVIKSTSCEPKSVSEQQTTVSSSEQKNNVEENIICIICREELKNPKYKGEKKKLFGLLPRCSHVFCYDCITKWRNSSARPEKSNAENNNAGRLIETYEPMSLITISNNSFEFNNDNQLCTIQLYVRRQQFIHEANDQEELRNAEEHSGSEALRDEVEVSNVEELRNAEVHGVSEVPSDQVEFSDVEEHRNAEEHSISEASSDQLEFRASEELRNAEEFADSEGLNVLEAPSVLEGLTDPVELDSSDEQSVSDDEDNSLELNEGIQQSQESILLPKTTTRACPVCRKESFFVIPSYEWTNDEDFKNQLIEEFKNERKNKLCEHFCPFGNCSLRKKCGHFHPASCSKAITAIIRRRQCYHRAFYCSITNIIYCTT